MTVEYLARKKIRSLCTERSAEQGTNYWNQSRIWELTIDSRRGDSPRRYARSVVASPYIANSPGLLNPDNLCAHLQTILYGRYRTTERHTRRRT